MLFIKFAIVVFIIVIEMFLEFVFRKIADILILPLIILGFLANIIMSIAEETNILVACAFSLIGFLIGFMFCCTPKAFKGLGEGDVKFMTFIGAFMGPKFTIWCGIYSFIIGGVLAVMTIFYKALVGIKGDGLKKTALPFGIPILLALVLTAYIQGIF